MSRTTVACINARVRLAELSSAERMKAAELAAMKSNQANNKMPAATAKPADDTSFVLGSRLKTEQSAYSTHPFERAKNTPLEGYIGALDDASRTTDPHIRIPAIAALAIVAAILGLEQRLAAQEWQNRDRGDERIN